MATDKKSFQTFRQNYNWVIGLSKTFNPEACFEKGSDKYYLTRV